MNVIEIVRTTIMLVGVSIMQASDAAPILTPNSAELERLRIQIEAQPNSEATLLYLTLFPKTFNEFENTFGYTVARGGSTFDDYPKLYDYYPQHMDLLERLAVKHPRVVLDIWLNISANGKSGADAVSRVQGQLITYAAKETETFAQALLAKTCVERKNIVAFLADVENHDAYPEYAATLNNLRKQGRTELWRLFRDAKSRREQYTLDG